MPRLLPELPGEQAASVALAVLKRIRTLPEKSRRSSFYSVVYYSFPDTKVWRHVALPLARNHWDALGESERGILLQSFLGMLEAEAKGTAKLGNDKEEMVAFFHAHAEDIDDYGWRRLAG